MLKNVLALIAMALPTPLIAEDWWYAESDRFRVYSAGGSEAAETMAIKLERLDQAMRLFTGVAAGNETVPEVAKPTIFQFGTTDDIGDLAGRQGVAGFFIPRAGNSVAYVPLEDKPAERRNSSPGARQSYDFLDFDIAAESVLFHEYAHYFMFQHAPAAYPAWYIEGLAEVFGQLKLRENGFDLGEPPIHRQGEIALVNFDINQMFPRDDRNLRSISYPYYGHGWLLASYLSFSPERKGQLANFLRAINGGTKTREAAVSAFGELDQLEDEVNRYRRQRSMGMSARFPSLEEPDVDVRKLAPDEVARMSVFMRSNRGVSQQEAKKIVGETRRLVESYPDSASVLRAALEAEFDADNLAEADALAKRLIARGGGVDGNLYLAQIALKHAETDKAWLQTARTHFRAANQIDPNEPNALAGYYLTFRLAGQEPPEDALIALENAFALAPFDRDIRLKLAHLLLLEGKDKAALDVLGPVINQPHGGKRARDLRDLVDKLKAGDRQPLIADLAPSLDDEEEEG